jgi:type II secretory pathway pseudopilin PulG
MSDWPELQMISVVAALIGVLLSLVALVLARRKASRNEQRPRTVASDALSVQRSRYVVRADEAYGVQMGDKAAQKNLFPGDPEAGKSPE